MKQAVSSALSKQEKSKMHTPISPLKKPVRKTHEFCPFCLFFPQNRA